MLALSEKNVIELYEIFQNLYGSEIVRKQDSKFMRFLATFVPGISKEDFLNKFCTTVGNKIYITYTPGNASEVPLWEQVVILVHEHVHVQQFRDTTWFSLKYLLSKKFRANVEAEAYGVGSALLKHYHLSYSPDWIFSALKRSYGIDDKTLNESKQVFYDALASKSRMVTKVIDFFERRSNGA